MWWPILIIVASNCFYNICTKSTPEWVDTWGTLMITYLVAAGVTAALFVWHVRPENALTELTKVNWTSFVLGAAIVGLEVGYILLYRAGWKVGVGALVANICLACALLVVGTLLYHETVTLRQVLGVAVCAAGLVMIKGA